MSARAHLRGWGEGGDGTRIQQHHQDLQAAIFAAAARHVQRCHTALDIFLKELKSSLLAGGRKRSRVLRGQAPEHGIGCPRAADAAPQPVMRKDVRTNAQWVSCDMSDTPAAVKRRH